MLTNGEIYTAYIEAANQTLRPQDERIALAFARAIEAAVIDKLSAGVSVEPYCKGTTANIPNAIPDLFTQHQINTAIAAARVAALEEAAKVCDEYASDRWNLYKGRKPYSGTEQGRADPDTQGHSDGASVCADAIRALKEST